MFPVASPSEYKENVESMTAFTIQLKDGRILNRQHRSALLVSSTSWTGNLFIIPFTVVVPMALSLYKAFLIFAGWQMSVDIPLSKAPRGVKSLGSWKHDFPLFYYECNRIKEQYILIDPFLSFW